MLKKIIDIIPEFFSLPRLGIQADSMDGNMEGPERDDLMVLVAYQHAKAVFEFGTFNGATSLALTRVPGVERVWSLDIPRGQAPALEMLAVDRNYLYYSAELPLPGVTRLWGDSARFDFAPFYGCCDVVFVMGAHSLPYIRNDLGQAFKLARPGGLVVWHAGTVEPVEPVAREFDVYQMNSRMGIVRPLGEL